MCTCERAVACMWRHCLCNYCPALLLSKRESLLRKSELHILATSSPKHYVVIDASVRPRGARLPASLFSPGFFVLLSLAFQSLPQCCPFFLSFDILSFIPVPLSFISQALFFLNLLSSCRVLPCFSSPPFIICSCSLIIFYLWAHATFRLNTKHRGKHWTTFF